jgi:hypothetical protein
MNELLQRAYDALQQADAAGNAEDAQKIADYIRELEAQAMVQDEKKPAPADDSGLHNPMTYGLAGAAAGRLLGPAVGAGIDTAARSMMGRKPPAPGAAPAAPAAPAAAPRVEPSIAPPQPARLSEPPSLLDEPAIKVISHNTQQVIGHPAAMSLARKPEPGFEVRPGRLIATPEGADLSVEAPPPQPQAPPTRSAAQLSAPPPAAPPAAPPKPSMLSRMSRNLAEPKKAPLYLGGAMAAGQGRDAYEQAREGNIGQAAMSGAGAVGGLGMLSRIKPIRAAGTLMGLGVPLTRMYKSLTEDEENVERRAAGGLAGYAKGKKVKEAFEYGSKQAGKLSDWAQNYINQYLTPIQSDRMAGVGGPSFSANSLARPEYEGFVWGQGKPSAASAVGNLALDKRYGGPGGQVFAPLVGEAQMHKSNQIIFDRMLEDFYKNPEKLTPELRSTINDYIRSGGMIRGKTKQTFDPIEGFDIADRSMVESLGKTFDKRKAIAQHAFGGEGIGGRKAQIIPYEQILKETTDPNVLGAPTFSVGPRAFKLTGETVKEPRPDLNAAFPYLLQGEDLRVTYNPVPSELSLMDFQRQWRKDTGKTLPLKSGKLPQPGYYEHTMGYKPTEGADRVYPRQKMTEEWVKEIQRSGFRKGGLS